jgi:hypothetical protein
MSGKTPEDFGKRRPPTVQPGPPVKRSGHVALLVMGTVAIGSGAYALMPRENCDPNRPGIATDANVGKDCSRSSSSSSGGGHGYSSRTSFFSGDSGSGSSTSSSSTSSSTSSSEAGHVSRGGFGSFAHAMSAHFSGGG